VQSIAKRDPELAERAKRLLHVMPPRPGGLRALLEASPGTDVVVIAHAGFEGFSTIKDIVTNTPIGRQVEFRLKRVPRSEIPTEDPAFTNWLFDQYEWIDRFVEDHHVAAGNGRAKGPTSGSSASVESVGSAASQVVDVTGVPGASGQPVADLTGEREFAE